MHLVVLAAYIGSGIAVSWPRASYLADHKLPHSRDGASYVWGFWWVARQVEHLSNPWFTRYIAAPAGADLGFHALMPLEGVVMMPITIAFGPAASYNLLTMLLPGLLCYAMYRVGRLWLPSQTGAIAAGAFFGLSSMLVWRSWYHLNLAAGVLFIPLALEGAVRLRRRPTWGQAVILGVIVGAALLTDQESAVLVMLVTTATLLPYLFFGSPRARRTAGEGTAGENTAGENTAGEETAGGGHPPPARKSRAPAPLRAMATAVTAVAGAIVAVSRAIVHTVVSVSRAIVRAVVAAPGAIARAAAGSLTVLEWIPGTLSLAAWSKAGKQAWAKTAGGAGRAAASARTAATSSAGSGRAGLWLLLRSGAAPAIRAAWAILWSVIRRVWPLVLAGLVALAVASPQIMAMIHQTRAGGATSPPGELAVDYAQSGVTFPGMFGISPRVNNFGLQRLDHLTYQGPIHDGVPTFGLLVTVLAVVGLIFCWRRRSAWLLMLLWLGCGALALGATFKIGHHTYVPDVRLLHGVRLSGIMPFTWFVKIPGLQGFREAARITMLGIAPAALLAGAAVNWLRYHAAPAVVLVLALGIFEAGWAGNPGVGTMPTAMPELDGPIAADHSSSLVLDVPFGIRGGVPLPGEGAAFNPEAQVLATTDGHPRAVAFLSRTPGPTLAAIKKEPFYAGLLEAQEQPKVFSLLLAHRRHHHLVHSAQLTVDQLNAHRMNIGWVLVWRRTSVILRYLKETGFVYDYQADGVLVYRAAPPQIPAPPGRTLASTPGELAPHIRH